MISLDEALRLVLARARVLPGEVVRLDDALARHLARDVRARWDLPAYDNSAMDGYAVRAADVASATGTTPARLRVVGRVLAGERPTFELGPGEAARIMTGARVPPGADAVVRQEATLTRGDAVDVRVSVETGKNIRGRGEQFRDGDVVLRRGQRVTPDAIAVLASVGQGEVAVTRRPRVSVLTCGDELRPPERATAREIIDSNGPMISAMAREAGAIVERRGPAPDEAGALGAQLIAAAGGADVLITIGGASVGARDLVPDALVDGGAEFLVRKVAIKPGKPLSFAMWGELPVFVLPGNPEACARSFDLLARPLITAMLGGDASEARARRLPAILMNAVRKQPALTYFIRGTATLAGDGLRVRVAARQGSAQVGAGLHANAIAVIPAGRGQFTPGERVELELRGPPTMAPSAPLLAFAGYSGSGKTSAIVALIRRLSARGLRVAALKHDAHEFQLDREGKDTDRFTRAGATAIAIGSPTRRATISKTPRPSTLHELVAALTVDLDLIVVEGYKRADVPKIVVNRRGVEALPVGDGAVAVITDEPSEAGELPAFRHDDHDGVEAFVLGFLERRAGAG